MTTASLGRAAAALVPTGDAVTVFGVPLHALTMAQTVSRVEQLVASGGAHQHVVLNAAKVVQVQHDEDLRRVIADCSLVNADGQSIVWAARMLGIPVPERVTGIDLMERLLDRAEDLGWSVYFLGARDAVVERVVALQRERRPRLTIAGWRNGYWTPEQEAEVVAQVAATSPTLLLAAMPTPAKEHFLARHLDDLGVNFAMGVGGAFDVVAGVTQRAPGWMQRAGLEWFYRLVQEPRRMFKRYLVGNTRFILLTLRELVRG